MCHRNGCKFYSSTMDRETLLGDKYSERARCRIARPLFLSNVTECTGGGRIFGAGSLTRACATKQMGINAKIIQRASRYSAKYETDVRLNGLRFFEYLFSSLPCREGPRLTIGRINFCVVKTVYVISLDFVAVDFRFLVPLTIF